MNTILVVDDEEILLTMMTAVLEDLGYGAVTAPDGLQALDLLDTLPAAPRLIVSDIMMPGLDGVALAQAVRGDERLRDTPIILMSALEHPTGDSPADHFMHKPFDVAVLAEMIDRLDHQQKAN